MNDEQGMTVLQGTIVTGIGDFAQWIAKYQEYYLAKTGLSLFPGTLNLRLDHPYQLPSAKVIRLEGHEYGSRVSVSILPVRLFGRSGVILRPDLPPWATATDAEDRLSTLELATDVRLRDTYGLKDGDVVEVTVL
jgi:riboflavin kinase, archaea type